MSLADRTCPSCIGVSALSPERAETLAGQLGGSWQVTDRVRKEFSFPDFRTALEFVNRVGDLADRENHHPDVFLGWGRVRFEIWTHSANGLTEADFVLAAKIDRAFDERSR